MITYAMPQESPGTRNKERPHISARYSSHLTLDILYAFSQRAWFY
jgi:hypothetical protein